MTPVILSVVLSEAPKSKDPALFHMGRPSSVHAIGYETKYCGYVFRFVGYQAANPQVAIGRYSTIPKT